MDILGLTAMPLYWFSAKESQMLETRTIQSQVNAQPFQRQCLMSGLVLLSGGVETLY